MVFGIESDCCIFIQLFDILTVQAMPLSLSAALTPANAAGRRACEEDKARNRQQSLEALQDIAGIWRGADWHASQRSSTWPTGYAALDAELPGGGWPVHGLTEVLQPAHCHAEWALLLPALSAQAGLAAEGSGRREQKIVLVQPPYLPFAPSLQAAGIAAQQLCCVYKPPALPVHELAWACEQALHCQDVLAVLAWLPSLPASSLRRLHWAAVSQGRPLWLWQGLNVQGHSTPAALRLRLDKVPQSSQESALHALQIQILKRRGPVLDLPIQLSLSQWAWTAVLQAQSGRRAAQSAEAALLMQGRMAPAPSPGTTGSVHGFAQA